MGIGNKIKQRRIELGMSQDELAKAMGYTSRSTINKIEKDINDITQSKIIKFAEVLHTTQADLMSWDNSTLNDKQIYSELNIDYLRIPLYSPICCGDGGFNDDNVVEEVTIPSKGLQSSYNYFAQVASGESMIDAGINDGDLLVFEKVPKVIKKAYLLGFIFYYCINN